jgi:hypothetical protein
MSLIGATVFIGIATSVLAVGSWVAAVYAVRAFRKQTVEVKTLKDEAERRGKLTDQQTEVLKAQKQWFDDQHSEQRRAQASMVFITTATGPDPRRIEEQIEKGVPWREGVTAHVKNSSGQPVYDLTIDWRQGTARWGEPDYIPVLMPGSQQDRTSRKVIMGRAGGTGIGAGTAAQAPALAAVAVVPAPLRIADGSRPDGRTTGHGSAG